MKKIQYAFWLIFVSYFASTSEWSHAQIAFMIGAGVLLYMTIVMHLEGDTGNKSPTFNDAIAKELMRIRSDLAGLRINQIECDDEEKVPDNFLRMFWLYFPYTSSFLCTAYQTPDKQWGKIIIELDSSIDIEEHCEAGIDAETLKKINSPKARWQFKKDMNVSVYISEPGINDAECSRHAKILSIKNGSSRVDDSVAITLEINLSTSHDEMYLSYFDSKDAKIETIIRDIRV